MGSLWQAFTSENLAEWYQNSATQFPVPWVKDLANTFKSAFPRDVKPYVSERGWQAESVYSYSNLAAKYAKGLPWTSDLGMTSAKHDTNTAFIDAVVIPSQPA